MKTIKFENEKEWLAGRLAKSTGSNAGDLISKTGPTKETIMKALDMLEIEYKKAAKKEDLEVLLPKQVMANLIKSLPKKMRFYEIIAESLGVPADDEVPMVRGHRLEPEAMQRFEKETGKKLNTDLIMWVREDNERIAVSPDAYVVGENSAVEGKCKKSSIHVKAFLTQEIPEEFNEQKLQYFAVNEYLETLYFLFFDPRFPQPKLQYFVIEVKRKDIEQEVQEFLQAQRDLLAEVDEIVLKLSDF
jgi:hypothetical protein